MSLGAAAAVLRALRAAETGLCSGEALSKALGVSRSQIWKHVGSLRARGYQIDGSAGGGYELRGTPDRLFPEEILPGLETRRVAREIEHFETVDSTNRVAHERARSGAPHGYTVIAEAQTAGRGRLGRDFFSPAHENLYTSIILRPALTTASCATSILAAAVAVAETALALLEEPNRVAIKWPNDVLVDGKKTSGILMELAAEATRVDYLVLGVGINVNSDPATFPEAFRDKATSLAAARGARVDRIGLARDFFRRLEAILELHEAGGFAALRERFDARFAMRGREIAVSDLDGSSTRGRAEGVDDDGALLLRLPDGELRRLFAGDVTIGSAASPGAEPLRTAS
ncbi:MAG: biotin--[acetyl-CoA-carboxylase] ligase [Myxococcales bacterium]|nr:biotin--[acetyl-CoA-carboxylase] ligase [Myxococcales bacterium]